MDLNSFNWIIFFAVGWVFGRLLFSIWNSWQSIYQEAHKEVMNEISARIHAVEVEKHNGVDYWFDADNGQFLGQGVSLDEIVNHVKSRFPEHIFLLNKMGLSAQTNWKFLPGEDFKRLISKQG